jgi:hypothetical protein
MRTHFTLEFKPLGVPTVARPQGNRRIRRARGFHRAWLIANHLQRFEDEAGVILNEALMHMWLTKQRRWA